MQEPLRTTLESIVITDMKANPTKVYFECTDSTVCLSSVANLLKSIQAGTVNLNYYVVWGEDASGTRFVNPVPKIVFPPWAIGVIIGGVALFGLGIMLICACCAGERRRRKKAPAKVSPKAGKLWCLSFYLTALHFLTP